MTNKELLKILLIDKIEKEVKELSFKNKAYWNEFKDNEIYGEDYHGWDINFTYEEILKGFGVRGNSTYKTGLDFFNLRELKNLYIVFTNLKEKDEKYSPKE